MKKLLSLVFAGTLSLVLAGWALSQVPAALVRSGIIIGTSGAQSASANIVGTASFNAASGSIASLVETGIVTGVTYTSTGTYAVSLSGSPANYLVQMQLSNDSGTFIGAASVIYNSVTTSGFTMLVTQLNGGGFTVRDFPINYITVIK